MAVQVGGIQDLRDTAARDGAFETIAIYDALPKLPLIGAGCALHPFPLALFPLVGS